MDSDVKCVLLNRPGSPMKAIDANTCNSALWGVVADVHLSVGSSIGGFRKNEAKCEASSSYLTSQSMKESSTSDLGPLIRPLHNDQDPGSILAHVYRCMGRPDDTFLLPVCFFST